MCSPLAIDLFCGLGGWTDGLLSEGWDVIGFDIERHVYGKHRYPAQLVLQKGEPWQSERSRLPEGTKVGGRWFHDASPGTLRHESGRSTARKAASARIAKIPLVLARHIAHTYRPDCGHTPQGIAS